MARRHLPSHGEVTTELKESLARGEKSLDILENHAVELSAVEQDIQLEMKRKDREYKDSHFHSVPKPIKHIRP